MRNQPKYGFIKNTTYAFAGFKSVFKYETSFKIELVIAILLVPVILFIDFSLIEKLLLFYSIMFVLVGEIINSAIERVVDLVTLEYHDLAKAAKDVGSLIVLSSIFTSSIIWSVILLDHFYGCFS